MPARSLRLTASPRRIPAWAGRYIGAIRSVLMLSISSGAAGPTSVVSAVISLSHQFARIGNGAGTCGRRRNDRACQMRAAARALTPDKITVRGRHAALAARHDVAVGPDAHGAPGLAPLKASGAEDRVEALGLRLPLDGG